MSEEEWEIRPTILLGLVRLVNAFQVRMISALARFQWRGEKLQFSQYCVGGSMEFCSLHARVQVGETTFAHEFTSEFSVDVNLQRLEAALWMQQESASIVNR